MQISATAIAAMMAAEQYFFSVCLTDAEILSIGLFPSFFIFGDFENLAIDHIRAACNSEEDKNRYKYASQMKQSVQKPSCKKTYEYAARHSQPKLHNDRKIFNPIFVVFIAEQHGSKRLSSDNRKHSVSIAHFMASLDSR
jgi:hypothetical protein